MKHECWIVTYRDQTGDDGVWAFFKKEDAIKCVEEDYYTEFKSLTKEGYKPECAKDDTDWKELYVPNTGVYSEWHIEQSTIE